MTETTTPKTYGVIQLALPQCAAPAGDWLRDLLASRGLFLYKVPDIGGVPTYGIGAITTGSTSLTTKPAA